MQPPDVLEVMGTCVLSSYVESPLDQQIGVSWSAFALGYAIVFGTSVLLVAHGGRFDSPWKVSAGAVSSCSSVMRTRAHAGHLISPS